MRKLLLVGFAAAVLASNAVLLHRAAAMTLAARSALGTATAPAGLVQKVTNVCGPNGCVAVQVKRLDKHQLHKTAVPQTTPQTLPHGLPGSIS
jgi:hypothetical protein